MKSKQNQQRIESTVTRADGHDRPPGRWMRLARNVARLGAFLAPAATIGATSAFVNKMLS